LNEAKQDRLIARAAALLDRCRVAGLRIGPQNPAHGAVSKAIARATAAKPFSLEELAAKVRGRLDAAN